MAVKRIVYIGGGPCTLVSLRRIAEETKKAGIEVENIVITKDKYHYFPAFFPDVALGEAEPDDVRAPVENFTSELGAKLYLDEVTRVDPANRVVETKSGKRVEYDYLFICAGTRYAWEEYPGLREASYHNYTLEGALELRKALAGFRGGDIVVLVPEFPHRCPGYPFEVLGRLVYHAKRRGVNANVKLVHAVPMDAALSHLFDLAVNWHRIHQEIGNIEYIMGKQLERVDPGSKTIFFKDGESMKYDLLITAPPCRVPKFLEDTDFVFKKDPRFLDTTFPTFRSRKYDDVFIPTDSAMPSVNLPFAGVPVHYAAVAAADTVLSELKGASGPILFPDVLTIVLDFGKTGVLVTFDVKEAPGGVAATKPYIAITHPMIKLLKYSFYAGWIKSLKK
ncbi:FAD/NAD(P)-binding oxidoreductase [Pyrofollis japonicus]|uniref:NAD(P)/FAD-dependent oxidoreductase n=1 Tax=Pyrofollis japonicus TaxID=3060460 RepID=UPI00295B03E6|nr:FAD/NAD(P)-binding oxidoreductase [Pyrofollis japonicus]BEP16876.1 FAD/NAD(P)-binding oxidoreductase [Pyrofollis japonicus]